MSGTTVRWRLCCPLRSSHDGSIHALEDYTRPIMCKATFIARYDAGACMMATQRCVDGGRLLQEWFRMLLVAPQGIQDSWEF